MLFISVQHHLDSFFHSSVIDRCAFQNPDTTILSVLYPVTVDSTETDSLSGHRFSSESRNSSAVAPLWPWLKGRRRLYNRDSLESGCPSYPSPWWHERGHWAGWKRVFEKVRKYRKDAQRGIQTQRFIQRSRWIMVQV